ncbi:hypothetical protein K8Z61_18035 [Nocardioides sp. TRM66260-LWL]|uniref:WD40/YVTN/BNR-like repeat-containing protein n=1 Tax=Nocardioides sp. TRM66260-LWL TaxID=2874478 RepID=UPI001CC7AAD4|nr:hypothetical protein [Nocardioides sp. TRM66260-LWL]MBZ5736395.1 hypothetical protein [Nocardioides sp. TRM66260-LWL]
MSTSADNRLFGLSPRARRFVIPAFVVMLAVIIIGTYANRRYETASAAGPVVGGDLHAVAQMGDRVFVGGHGGAGYRLSGGGWTQITSLDDKDVMAWGMSGATLFAGGHAGLFTSTDAGQTFNPVRDMSRADVHAVGASDDVIYLATTDLGVMVSHDGGRVFDLRSEAGRAFMGTIWVDPANPDVAIAPSMQQGVVKTTDGGRTWSPLGSAMGSMAVAVDRNGTNMVEVGMDGAQQSNDGGQTWSALAVPQGTSAASYTSSGDLLVAALAGDRANVYRQTANGWDPLV